MDGPWEFSITAVGALGSATIGNFVNVHQDDRLTLRHLEGERVEHSGIRSTYHYQMDALAAAVLDGQPFPTGADDAIANMQMIDACYLASGLAPRQGGGSPAARRWRTTEHGEAGPVDTSSWPHRSRRHGSGPRPHPPPLGRRREPGRRVRHRSGARGTVAASAGAQVHTSDDELIGSRQVDAVIIASHDSAHAAQVLACIRAGKPVLCEKPLAPSIEDCQEIVTAQQQRGLGDLVSIGFMRRFHPGFTAMRGRPRLRRSGRTIWGFGVSHRNVRSYPTGGSEGTLTN